MYSEKDNSAIIIMVITLLENMMSTKCVTLNRFNTYIEFTIIIIIFVVTRWNKKDSNYIIIFVRYHN